MSICTSCGQPNRDEARFCSKCGGGLQPRVSMARVAAPTTLPPTPLTASAANGPTTVAIETRRDTERPGAAAPPGLLPLGELLNNRRYVVTEALIERAALNSYRAASFAAQPVCPACGSSVSATSDRFCPACGVSLTDQTLAEARYVIKEASTSTRFIGERQIAQLRLNHPSLVRLHEYFEAPGPGGPRFYMVYDETEAGESLEALEPQPSPPQAAGWGAGLAEGLAYLHQHGVLHRGIGSAAVVLSNGQAYLTGFTKAEYQPGLAPDERKQAEAEDVGALAAILTPYICRDSAAEKAARLPSSVADALQRATSQTPSPISAYDLAETLRRAQLALSEPESAVTWRVAWQTNVGHVRELNEDSLFALHLDTVSQPGHSPFGLFIVADGMGGQAAGEIASQTAIKEMARHVTRHIVAPLLDGGEIPDVAEALRAACQQANKTIYDMSRRQNNDMGTTCVAAIVRDRSAVLANVGDSRAYLVDDGGLTQITVDHSLVERLITLGKITRDQARTHPDRNLILRHLGEKAAVEIDVFTTALQPRQWLVLCSDGLNSMIDDDVIYQAVVTAPTPEAACRALIDRALAAGGDDNVSVIVLHVT